MRNTENSPGVLRFGIFDLDARTGELRKHGVRVRLQGKPLQNARIVVFNYRRALSELFVGRPSTR